MKRRSQASSRRGATLVEFAFVLPLLMLFFMGSIELFRLNQFRHAADQAAYEACRRVIVPGATQAEAEAEALKVLKILGVKKVNVKVTPTVITETTPRVTVQVSIPAAGNSLAMPAFGQESLVSSTATLLTERSSGVVASAIPK
jgi:Flp pilus assembly protein TadG